MRFFRGVRRSSGLRAKTMGGAALAVCLGVLSFAPAASAEPTGEFAPFKQCPVSKPTVLTCLYSVSSSGSFTVGTKTVPLVNPVTLQGGLESNPETFEAKFVGAADGNTLSKTPQPVPGGLLGIKAPTWWPKFLQDLFNEEVINKGLTGVTATVELAAPASSIKINLANIVDERGTALSLPIKVKLSNPFLGSNCYIGSNSNPIFIDFTTGTTSPPPPNTPISGDAGTLSLNEAGTIGTFSGGRFVNNSFAAPAANGCGGLFSIFVDPLVNSILGTPAAAGRNTAILEGKIQVTSAANVKASEP
jgi:hypothetical protein